MSPHIASSWDIVWRLVRGYPDLRVYETHPGGGTYDCLTIMSETVKIDINRVGSIHVHYSPGGEAIPLISAERWTERSQEPGGTQGLADEILEFCRVPKRKHAPTPYGVTYRVISRVLAAQQYDSHEWDARSQYEDTSGYGGGIRWPVPSPEMNQIAANEVWLILRSGRAVAWLWNGWVWTDAGERLNIFGRFQSRTSTTTLAAMVTERSVAAGTVLPEVPLRADQPVGSWPQQGGDV